MGRTGSLSEVEWNGKEVDEWTGLAIPFENVLEFTRRESNEQYNFVFKKRKITAMTSGRMSLEILRLLRV